MTALALACLLIVLAVVPAAAEPPGGFADFAWGTSPAVIREQFVPKRCRTSIESRRVWYSVGPVTGIDPVVGRADVLDVGRCQRHPDH